MTTYVDQLAKASYTQAVGHRIKQISLFYTF